MNAVYANGPGDDFDWHGEQLDKRMRAIEREAEERRNERKNDLDWLEMAACDALTQSSIDAIKPSNDREATDKATAYKRRALILSLITTGSDNAELGRLMCLAANDAFDRECWASAEKYVDHMLRCGAKP